MVRGLDGYFLSLPSLACAVFKLHRASRRIPVVHSERETPLPIPNRAVKPFSADGTWGATPWESRSPPVLHDEFEPPSGGSSSFLAGFVAALPAGPRLRNAFSRSLFILDLVAIVSPGAWGRRDRGITRIREELI